MNLFEWEEFTKDMCHCCRSREFNSLSYDDRDELIEKVGNIYETKRVR